MASSYSNASIAEDDDDDWEDEDSEYLAEEDNHGYGRVCIEDETDYDSDDSDGRCLCSLHAPYWT